MEDQAGHLDWHSDSARVAAALSAYRSLLKSDGRVVQRLHRRVFLSEVTPEGLMCRISFYVEAKNKDQFSGINQDFLSAFLETLRKNDVRLAVPMRGVMQMQDSDEILAELERYREKERKEKDEKEMIELSDEGLPTRREPAEKGEEGEAEEQVDGGARGDLGVGVGLVEEIEEEGGGEEGGRLGAEVSILRGVA